MIDHLGYFETIRADFNTIREWVNPAAELPHTNRSTREDYRQIYTPAMIDRVATLYAGDIAMLGYSFDGLARKQVLNGKLIDA